jgi:predicted ester cyclase
MATTDLVTEPSARPSLRKRITQDVDPIEYKAIRKLWIDHSRAEDARDIPGLIATLTEDCVYEVAPTGERWEGHDGARQFYATLLGAFPDVTFNVTDIVIGPQGVIEIADLVGTHLGRWAGLEPTGRPVNFKVIILFPWNRPRQKFDGEKVFFDRSELMAQLTL